MKFKINIFVLLLSSLFLQGSDFKMELNPLAEPLSFASGIDDQISQHLSDLELNRKEVLLQVAKALTISQDNPKITRGMLKEACTQLPQVLLKTPADNNIKIKVDNIHTRFRSAKCSSCYGYIPFWKSHSNGTIRQEAIDLKQAINISLFLEKNHTENSENYEAPSCAAQVSSAPQAPVVTAVPYSPEFIAAKNES